MLARYSLRLSLSLIANLHAVAFFARDVQQTGITLIHGYFLNLPGLIAMGASIIAGIPFTAAGHARDVYVEGAAVSRLVRRARFIVFCHAAALVEIVPRIPQWCRGRLRLIHHGIDVTGWSARNAHITHNDEHMIVAVGRLVTKKGYAHLIRACTLLKDGGERFRLMIIGDGPQETALRQLADECGVTDRITWAGWLSKIELQRRLHQADAIIVPSVVADDGDRDGIPNVVFEAWAAGVPVIASSLPSLFEVITNEINGLLVEPENPSALAEAIHRVLTDPHLQAQLAAQGQRHLNQRFNLRMNTAMLIALFEKAHD